MKSTLIDHPFSLCSNAAASITNAVEDYHLTTPDAFEAEHTVVASQIINELCPD